jgi:hypothetical protein
MEVIWFLSAMLCVAMVVCVLGSLVYHMARPVVVVRACLCLVAAVGMMVTMWATVGLLPALWGFAGFGVALSCFAIPFALYVREAHIS